MKNYLLVTLKSDQDPDPDPHCFASWVPIRIEIKSWIRIKIKSWIWIPIETNADPQDCTYKYFLTDQAEKIPTLDFVLNNITA
jgi:hypothetical protein